MTPLQLANAECANLRDSTCQGIGIRDNGSLLRLWKPKPCDVNSCRCIYFEDSVAAGIRSMPSGPKRDSWLKAIESYLKNLNPLQRGPSKTIIFGDHPDEAIENMAQTKSCQKCQKPVEGIRRFCPSCADENQRAANRNRKIGGPST